MQPQEVRLAYQPNQLYRYPFTLISNPPQILHSQTLQQPFCYEVYCPISCKKVKIGATNTKNKEAIQFNTTANRWVNTYVDQNIKYLINKHPPYKKDKKKVQGQGWSAFVSVSDKGNYAIFNPYCLIPFSPISFYTFKVLQKCEAQVELEKFQPKQDQEAIEIDIGTKKIYVKNNDKQCFIGHNKFFNDNPLGKITITNPNNQNETLTGQVDQLFKSVQENKSFWLNHLNQTIQHEQTPDSKTCPSFNLDTIYENLTYYLNIDEQIRAKLMSSVSKVKLNQLYGNHPRIYSAFSRLASFVNYGNTKYNTRKLAEFGFYNRSDMLQDLAYFENNDIVISNGEDVSYKNQNQLRRKLFPFSRLQNGLPFPNIPLETTINSLMHQSISKHPLHSHSTQGDHILFVDKEMNFSVWSTSLFAIKLFQGNVFNSQTGEHLAIYSDEKQFIKEKQEVLKEADSQLASLFEEQPPAAKDVKPVEIVAEPSMIEQMLTMGYGISVIKKALIAVKNESVPAAIDAIEQIMAEDKKNKKQKKAKKDWSCSVCTYLNKSDSDTCQMCGNVLDLFEQEEKERVKIEEEDKKQREKKEQEEKLLKQREEQQARVRRQEQEKKKQQQIYLKQKQLRQSKLLFCKLHVNNSTPLNPFYIILAFYNQNSKKTYLKIFRYGIDRHYFIKFYRIEQQNLRSNFNNKIYPVNFESFNQIMKDAKELIEWQINLIQKKKINQWILVEEKMVTIEDQAVSVELRGQDVIDIKCKNKSFGYMLMAVDSLKNSHFDAVALEKMPEFPKEEKNYKVEENKQNFYTIDALKKRQLILDQQSTSIFVELIEHLPAGNFKPIFQAETKHIIQNKTQGEIVMNEFIPLAIEQYEGSVFSGKHYPTTLLEKGNNLYISNYPVTSFVFKNNLGKQMFIENVTIVSSSKRLQRIYSVSEGLIFTANEYSWFHLAKNRFQKCYKEDYEQWLKNKKSKNEYRQYWQPVGFFNIQNNQVEVELEYKRPAKYIFLLPTKIKNPSQKKDEVYAIKLDFFGVKGRVEEEKIFQSQFSNFKNQGDSGCEITVQQSTQAGKMKDLDSHQIVIKKATNINSFNFLPLNLNYHEKNPLSVKTVYQIKIKSTKNKKYLKIESQNAKSIKVTVRKDPQQANKAQTELKSFSELAKLQNEMSATQIKNTVTSLKLSQLLHLILESDSDTSRYESLLVKIGDLVDFKENLFKEMTQIIPILCNDEIKVCQKGYKLFINLYERNCGIDLHRSFQKNIEALKSINKYIKQKRNKNYYLLRSKYNIEELVLQPYLFSKDYYRLVYPNYIEQPVTSVTTEPQGPMNNCMWLNYDNHQSYTSYLDLQESRKIQNIQFYCPKIALAAFRPKLMVKISTVQDGKVEQIYYRYFHEQTMVQLGLYGHKDRQIYKGQKLNVLTISDIDIEARMLKIQVSFLLLTSEPYVKYKDIVKLVFIPLVESKPSNKKFQIEKKLAQLETNYPKQTKHLNVGQNLPPSKYCTEGSKSIYNNYDFPIVKIEQVKKEYSEIVQKITTNIMDETIVRDSIKNIKINNYEFNKKGIDFAYTYLISLMNLNKKFSADLHPSVELMMELFDSFVVYESGPIMKKCFGYLQECYQRLSQVQKVTFGDMVVSKYLAKIDQINTFKISEKYSPVKILQKLKQFKLPISSFFTSLQNASNKSLKILLAQLITSNIQLYGIENLEHYNMQTCKYTRDFTLYDMISNVFSYCLWTLDNVQGVKEQIIGEGLDLLLILMSSQTCKYVIQNKKEAIKEFMKFLNQNHIWKLVFQTMTLKSDVLKQKIHKLFTILIENINESFLKSINSMLHQIIIKEEKSIYGQINKDISDELWMNHLQTTLEFISMTKSQIFLDKEIALKLLELPLTPTLWSLALNIIPRQDQILISILKNFKKEYYNSLGKQITKFCVPLAGIRSVQSLHINWLDLVKKIRLQGKNVFQLFMEELEKSSFGGKQGLVMATTDNVKQLEITIQFAKLYIEKDKQIKKEHFSDSCIRKLILWYFLNNCIEKGLSPATEKVTILSGLIKQLFTKISSYETVNRIAIKNLLQIRRQSQVIQRNIAEKRIGIHSALTLNKRFCQCFEELLGTFMTSDQLCSYFAFEIKGLQYVLRMMDIQANNDQQKDKRAKLNMCLPDEEILISQGLVQNKIAQANVGNNQIKNLEDLKQEQFANNVKLVPNLNTPNVATTTIDWTIYKKGNKSKVLFLPLTDSNYYQHNLYIQLPKTVQVRSIKIGFPAASYEFTDKVVITPSSVVIEGSNDTTHFQPIGEMQKIEDNGYLYNGVHVFALNCQKCRSLSNISESVKQLELHRIKYLKIVVKRPLVTFIQGQYSQLNGKQYNILGCNVSFLSVLGENSEKLPFTLIDSCKQISKKSSLFVLATLLNQSNRLTMKKISNNKQFASKIQNNFKKIQQYMIKYQDTMPNIVYLIGAGNKDMGDWIVDYFLREGRGEIQAKIINQIIISTPDKIFERISFFLKKILNKLHQISIESDIQSGVLYTKEIHSMQYFCKTLQECYEIGFKSGNVLDCKQSDFNNMINIYDKKYSSPEIKSLIKLMIYLFYLRQPLKLAENVIPKSMDLIWSNCSQSKNHFYNLMGALLIDKKAMKWTKQSDYSKIKSLLDSINKSIEHNNQKNLKLQMFLLCQISYHEHDFLRQSKQHIELYHKLKTISYQDGDIIESLLKILRNIILGNQEEQKNFAIILNEDVELLVKKRDPYLQKLYVGILGLESEVMINITGLDLANCKKQQGITSKYLSKKHQKQLLDKISKKVKFSPVGEINTQIHNEDLDLFLKSFRLNSVLMIIRFKINQKLYTCGVFNPSPSKRNQQDIYYWQQTFNFERNGFIFIINGEKDPIIITGDSQNMLGNIYGGEEEPQSGVFFYDNNSEEVIGLNFVQGQERISPRLSFYKYKQQLGGEKQFDNTISLDTQNFTFIGIEFLEVKHQQQVSVADNKLTSLLSKSNQAKAPFSYYRHSPIYIFPSKITVEKLMNILGIKGGSCQFKGKNVQEKEVLADLQKSTPDFIIDLEINNTGESGQDSMEQINEIGYIPIMNIFGHFSKINGVSKVLQLGSLSIKDWKKADRKKNFQHYMDQLKSFIPLPNFFNLFIKNQQYVTLIFEVASGMPDDENSTRNWQEQYVSNFRFIYKIVSDIFKFDKSPALRNMDNYSQFCEVILDKLSQISKESPRVLKEQQEEEESIEVPVGPVEKKRSDDRKRKKKGTGYGADNQNNSKWSASQWLQNRKNVYQQIQRVTAIFASFLDCEIPLEDDRLSEIVKQSCILPLLEAALRSSSLLQISKQPQLFKSYLSIIRYLSNHPATISCLLDIEKKYKPQQTQSVFNLLIKLNSIAEIFSECLKSGKEKQSATNEIAEGIAVEIHKTYIYVQKAVKNMKKKQKKLSMKEIDNMPLSVAYRLLLQPLRFGYVDLKSGNTYKHCLASSITSSHPSTNKILRLSQELADLSSSLPCQTTNSIFVRCDKSRIDVIQMLVMGSSDTPYSYGAFVFDVYCGDDYPNSPPKMLIATTGNGKIRFNPNLYSCGKVCLSLLGTWRGSASENWDAKVSTLLQLFISTQGITMGQDVYFNEPGFEGQQGTQQGERKNEAYSNIVRLGNVRYAMNAQIKNPPKGFEEVVKRHFYLKKKDILEQVEKWINYAEKRQASYTGLINDHNNSWCTELKSSKTKYKELLVKQYEELKKLLQELPPPNLQQEEQKQQNFKTESKPKQIKTQEVKLQEVDVEYDVSEKQAKKIEESVMIDRWSRYIGAMGVQAVKKQSESSVLLLGFKPLGLEMAKNLVLSGLKKLTIYDPQTIQDHNQHFYMGNMKGKPIKQCIFKIKELNPYMLVDYSEQIPQLKGYTMVVSTLSLEQSRKISKQCRASSVKFVYAQTSGVSGCYFSDFGQKFEVTDISGDQPFEGMIKEISIAEQGVVKLLEGMKHPYQDGDYIVLQKVEGMKIIKEQIQQKTEEQIFYEKMTNQKSEGINHRIFQIKVINWNSFSIGNTTNFSSYVSNGLCKNIKIPTKYQFKPFEICQKEFNNYLDPNLGIYDFEKMGDNENIFTCFKALAEFKNKNKRKPVNWKNEDSKQFRQMVKKIIEGTDKNQDDLKKLDEFANIFCYISQVQLPSIGAYFGGLVSQQVIKGLTNKYMPIKQFFTFHFNQMIQKLPEIQAEVQKLHIPKDTPFRGLRTVIGNESMNKIEEIKSFVVGAGAIGCQLLKNFAMINMGAKGQIVVTDPDHIQTSNLSRQFLFREKHVKKSKAATACATLHQLNPLLQGHIHARLDKVCEQTEQTYNNEFFKSRTLIANALDNVRARQYIDKRCVENKTALLESGTLGPKGHVQVIVPFKTENYGSQNDPNEQSQIPHCTLKMFPEQTVHCIQWSRDIFGKIFNLDPKALKKVIQAKDLNVLEGVERETVAKMIKHRPETYDDCIAEAVRKFYICFRNNVRQLLYTYPIDMKTKDGKPFWQLPKRPPKEVNQLDQKEESHSTFIASYSVLLAKIFGLPFPQDFRKSEGKQKIMDVARKVKVQDFVPSKQSAEQIQKQVEKQMNKGQQQQTEETNIHEEKQFQQINLTPQILEMKITAQQFQKDDDSNGHIDLIYSMSNLRCKNYGLAECTWIESKLKAGKIMAALSTTTSVVAALQTIQIIKLVAGSTIWRNAFVNLAVPIIQISEPGPPVKNKVGNTEFTVWEDWKFKCSTLKDLLTQIKEKYEVEGYNISTLDGQAVYWQAMYKDKQESSEALLNKSLKSMFDDKIIQLNILMRKIGTQQIFENVPKVLVQIVQ